MIKDHLLWVEKYRPHKISDCILPSELKTTFVQFVATGQVPNLILAGGAGIGKTTVARALCDEIGLDHILINGSQERGIDTLRTKITDYASAVALTGGRKVIIIDEADYLTGDCQAAFRGVIEEFAGNCSFVFTCNHKNRLIPPLHSRCAVINFRIAKEARQELAITFARRIETILKSEAVEFDRQTIVQLISKHFPDFRRVLNELQRYSVGGKIDAGILAATADARVDEAITYMRSKDFRALRKWVGVNADQDCVVTLRALYDRLTDVLKPEFVPAAIVLIGEWCYKDAFAADHEINLMAALSDLMLQVEFKE